MDSAHVPHFRAAPPEHPAHRRLRRARCDEEGIPYARPAFAAAYAEDREELASVLLRCRLVHVALTRCGHANGYSAAQQSCGTCREARAYCCCSSTQA